MKKTGFRMAAVLGAMAALTAGSAWADRPDHRHHRGHGDHRDGVRFSISIGTPWPAPPYPYRMYPGHPVRWPHVVVPAVVPMVPVAPVVLAPPRIYIEQAPARTAVPVLEAGYWYYCNEAGAYYPYVQTCPGDWTKVSPQSR